MDWHSSLSDPLLGGLIVIIIIIIIITLPLKVKGGIASVAQRPYKGSR